MNKIIIENRDKKNIIVDMVDMPLGSIGRIVNNFFYEGNIVRRTFSEITFIVENLNRGKDNPIGYWSGNNKDKIGILVELLPDAEIRVII